jgi:hypothetical protein
MAIINSSIVLKISNQHWDEKLFDFKIDSGNCPNVLRQRECFNT